MVLESHKEGGRRWKWRVEELTHMLKIKTIIWCKLVPQSWSWNWGQMKEWKSFYSSQTIIETHWFTVQVKPQILNITWQFLKVTDVSVVVNFCCVGRVWTRACMLTCWISVRALGVADVGLKSLCAHKLFVCGSPGLSDCHSNCSVFGALRHFHRRAALCSMGSAEGRAITTLWLLVGTHTHTHMNMHKAIRE